MSTTERKIGAKEYRRTQPVENQTIDHCILILKILHEGDKSKNQIFNTLKRDESKIPYKNDKSSTLEAIKHLRKSELVKENRSPPINKSRKKKRMKTQRIIVELTSLGKELSQLIYYLHQYELSYGELKKKIDYYFADAMMNLKPMVLRRRLEQKGWQDHEIEDSTLIEGVLFLETHLPVVLFDTILSRYLKIIYSCGTLSDLAKEILRRVIMDSITVYTLDRLEGILADKINSNKSVRDNAFRTTYILLSGWTTNHIENHVDTFSKNRFIQKESLGLVRDLYHILNPEGNFLRNVLKRKAITSPGLAALIHDLESSTTLSGGDGFKS